MFLNVTANVIGRFELRNSVNPQFASYVVPATSPMLDICHSWI